MVDLPAVAPPPRARRSALRVAVMTFGAVVLIGMMVSLAILGTTHELGDAPEQRGELIGSGLGKLGAACALVAYLVQRHRLRRG